MGEVLDGAWTILRIRGIGRFPALQLLQRLAVVLKDLPVDKFDLAAGRKGRDQPRNAVHDQARLTFAFAQRVLGALPLVDVRQQHAPANDVTACIAKRKAVVLEPAIERRPNLEAAARSSMGCPSQSIA